jgi:hypothetical protein
MFAKYSDKFRKDYKGYMEPLLLTACDHEAGKLNISRSQFLRYAAIRLLIRKKYPLNIMSSKFNDFYRGMSHNN